MRVTEECGRMGGLQAQRPSWQQAQEAGLGWLRHQGCHCVPSTVHRLPQQLRVAGLASVALHEHALQVHYAARWKVQPHARMQLKNEKSKFEKNEW